MKDGHGGAREGGNSAGAEKKALGEDRSMASMDSFWQTTDDETKM